MIGQEIGNYKIIDIIGKGGMAVVYLGHHKALTRRTVAIKMLSASLEGDFAFNERFFREAEVMDRLDHPNVVTLYDFIEHEGRYFIVMEYISGKTLAHLIQERGGPLPLEEVSVIFKQVFDAIAYAHDLGIVHRDLKPSNIMIDEKMQVKVTDFGIARLLGAGFEATLTATGMGMGSPYYMSPEQVLASKERPITAASDIYSLGITLYQAVTGKVPFNGGDSLFTIMQAHLKEQPPPPRQFASHLGPELERVILKAIEKKPEERWKNCREFWKNLEIAIQETVSLYSDQGQPAPQETPLQELPTATSSPTLTEPIESQRPELQASTKRPLALIISIIILLLAAGGGAAYYFLSSRADTPTPGIVAQGVESSGLVDQRASKATDQETSAVASILDEARRLLQTDQYEKALAKAQEALTIAPENKDAKLIKSLALKAKRAKEVQDLLLKAEVAFASGRYEEAIEAAGDALKIDPDNPKAGDLLGRAKVKLEEQERAKKALALKLDEAEALLESKAYTKASQVAKEVLSKDPQNSKAKAILAKARRGQRHKLTEAKLTEARSLIRAGKIQAALAKLDEVLKLNPKHPEAKRLKQDLVAKLNSKPNKQKEIERRLALAEDLIAAEQYERARIVIEKILDQDPDNKRAQDLLEMAQEGQKRKLLKQFLPPILPGANPQDIGIPGMGTPGQ